MLVFPLISHEEKLIGVVQLINAKNAAGEIIPFSTDCEKVLQSLGSQAAVAVSNMRFVQEIEDLMISITQVFTDGLVNYIIGDHQLADIVHKRRHQKFVPLDRRIVSVCLSGLMLLIDMIQQNPDIKIHISGMIVVIGNTGVNGICEYLCDGDHQHGVQDKIHAGISADQP